MSSDRKKKKPVSAATDLPLLRQPSKEDFGQELVNWLFPAYVTLIVLCVGAFVTRWTVVQGHEMPLDRAVLTAVNTATLTGLPQSVNASFFKLPGQFLILLLTVAGSLFSLLTGGLAVSRIIKLPYTDRQILRAALFAELIALILGACGLCGTGPGVLTGLSQGAAAFGNSGMSLGTPFSLDNWQTHLILLPMAFVGGLGITVLIEIYHFAFGGRSISNHTAKVLAMSLGIYVAALIVFVVLRSLTSVGGDMDFRSLVASSSAAAINSRTAGFPLEMAHQWPRFMQWIVMLLMMIGGSSGGTAGGLKTTTIVVLAQGSRRTLHGQLPGRAFGIALYWLGLYLLLALVGLMMLLAAEPQTEADRLAFLTVSGLSNVGLAGDVVNVTARGSYILSALMLCGRMVPLLILWWMADTTTDADLAVG